MSAAVQRRGVDARRGWAGRARRPISSTTSEHRDRGARRRHAPGRNVGAPRTRRPPSAGRLPLLPDDRLDLAEPLAGLAVGWAPVLPTLSLRRVEACCSGHAGWNPYRGPPLRGRSASAKGSTAPSRNRNRLRGACRTRRGAPGWWPGRRTVRSVRREARRRSDLDRRSATPQPPRPPRVTASSSSRRRRHCSPPRSRARHRAGG